MWGISIRQSFYRKPTTLEYHSSIINLPSKTAGSKFRPWFIEPLIAPYYLVRSINYKNHFIFRIDNKTTWFSCLMICKKYENSNPFLCFQKYTLILIKRILLQRFICSTLDGTYVLSVPQTADTTLRFHQTISKKSQSSKV